MASEGIKMDLSELLNLAVKKGATDLHLTVKSPPMFRIHGELIPADTASLNQEDTKKLVMEILSDKQKEVLQKERSLDLAHSIDGTGHVSRFRLNVFYQRGYVAAAFRRLFDQIPTLDELNLPAALYNLCDSRDGLVLITGPTGSGKSTTLASLIDRINKTRSCHIITIEDPVEYIHNHKKALINQRELHSDVSSFADGLRSALREDPDVILVGEMRDLDTMRTAVMAAETGHLVFSTLHTRDAPSTVARIIGVFPADEQEQIGHQLSMTLKSVVSQRLLRCKDGSGLVPATEIMITTSGIRNMIRLHKVEQIRSVIETGAGAGMQSMEHSLVSLYREGKIDRKTVLGNAKDMKYVERLLK